MLSPSRNVVDLLSVEFAKDDSSKKFCAKQKLTLTAFIEAIFCTKETKEI